MLTLYINLAFQLCRLFGHKIQVCPPPLQYICVDLNMQTERLKKCCSFNIRLNTRTHIYFLSGFELTGDRPLNNTNSRV